MEAALSVGATNGAIAALRESTPFRDVTEALLQRIAAIARPARYGAGARVYSAGEIADDLFVAVSGRVFGCEGLLLGQNQRLSSVTAAEPIEVLRINADQLVGLLESEPLERVDDAGGVAGSVVDHVDHAGSVYGRVS